MGRVSPFLPVESIEMTQAAAKDRSGISRGSPRQSIDLAERKQKRERNEP